MNEAPKLVALPREYGRSDTLLYKSDMTHAEWQAVLKDKETDIFEPQHYEFNLLKVIFGEVVQMVNDKIIEKAQEEYLKSNQNADPLSRFLKKNKGRKILFTKTWTF